MAYVMLSKVEINRLFTILSQHKTIPTTELRYKNSFTFLVAVMLSARTTDKAVNKVTTELFRVVNSAHAMLYLGELELKQYIRNIGLYNTKAANIIAMSKRLLNDYDGDVPCDFNYLISLPGIGRKTAHVVLNNVFKQPSIAVDTHVFRVSKRVGLTTANTVRRVEEDLYLNIPKKWQLYAHNWLVLHGRYICKAKNPLCGKCILKDICYFVKR